MIDNTTTPLIQVIPKLTPTLYRRTENDPIQLFYGGAYSGNYVMCTGNPITGSVRCADWATDSEVALFNSLTFPASSNEPTTIVFNTPGSDESGSGTSVTITSRLADVVVAAVTMLDGTASYVTDRTTLAKNNDARAKDADEHVIAFYFFCAVGYLLLIIITSVLFGWLIQFPKLSVEKSTGVWFLLWMILAQATALGGGFVAWVAMTIIMSVLSFIVFTVLVFHCFGFKKTSQHGVEMTERGKSGTTESEAGEWTSRPTHFGMMQTRVLSGMFAGLLINCIILAIIFTAWSPADYKLFHRENREILPEIASSYLTKMSLLIYAQKGVAKDFRFGNVATQMSIPCGINGQKNLTSDSDKKAKIYHAFIQEYDIDMSIFERTDYRDYFSVNDWFTRKLAAGARPIQSVGASNILSAPADARYSVFASIEEDFLMFLKADKYSLASLLDSSQNAQAFVGGSAMIVRLAPADYHRFHSPLSGTVGEFKELSGPLFSVNRDAVVSGNQIYYNKRMVGYIQSPTFGKVAYVAVGATCVGSVEITRSPGPIERGDELGFFRFGSTVVVLFEPGKVVFDPDLLYAAEKNVEVFVKMGRQIGRLGA
eukprot:TRINITY_DN360_c0_g1_i2.p1 TRINITY_DN360_c0_g1~~TRINITY_DN360_c0_g1_i2.p1  ORF type:complete len:677 (+),score=161.90 TRINITY_DN360_c0_g1_i2:238-2031(+)